MSKIDPFIEINSPNKFGYWINKKNSEAYGGQYISPLLCPNLEKVEKGFKKAIRNKKFLRGLEEQLLNYIGINTPILFSKELTDIAGGQKKIGKIFLKRTDLHHDSSHKPVNAFSSCYFAKHIFNFGDIFLGIYPHHRLPVYMEYCCLQSSIIYSLECLYMKH